MRPSIFWIIMGSYFESSQSLRISIDNKKRYAYFKPIYGLTAPKGDSLN